MARAVHDEPEAVDDLDSFEDDVVVAPPLKSAVRCTVCVGAGFRAGPYQRASLGADGSQVRRGKQEQFGEINTLVNNAAGNFMARTEKLTPNAFNAVVGIVLNGSFHCTQLFGKRWISRKLGGNVLNIVTTYAAANCGSGFVVPSACAKAGVLAMTTSLAVEWAKYHIRLNAIAPGPFPTEGAWSRLMPSKQFEDRAKDKHPMKRFGKHEELANLAAFLISDMAEYINGECVVIDGAQWLRGAGEFNDLLLLPEAAWEQMETAREKKN